MLSILKTGLVRSFTRPASTTQPLLTSVAGVARKRFYSDLSNYTLPAINQSSSLSRQQAPGLATHNPEFSYMSHAITQSPVVSRAASRTAGRSVSVMHDNPGQAYRQLSILLARNRVRMQLRKRERYEKPTQRRQREKKENDMRKFQRQVSYKVHLVKQMKDRGM
ncbi:hypothetical protein BDF22DRAFT_773145 [Syncephalis plumigaleata]|nr:hypothetical protein BDF22DRAFT_773145 [Syncephalis plumigaleata]